jgi:hypothetical protein
MNERPFIFSTTENEAMDILDVIRRLRNDLVKDFLDERNMIRYLSEQYRVHEISSVKMEFIKRDLKNLLIAPVDKEWYRSIIDEFHESGSAALSEGNEKLFYKEIEKILKKYLYSVDSADDE